MAKQRRNFTLEFKLEAVRRITADGKSLPEAARELGLGESLLGGVEGRPRRRGRSGPPR